jgi:hypothetical protein
MSTLSDDEKEKLQNSESKSHSHNAVTHGLFAKSLTFRSDEDERAFTRLWRGLKKDFPPRGMLERKLVLELATLLWKLQVIDNLELQELQVQNGKRTLQAVVPFLEKSRHLLLPGVPYDGTARSVKGWQCDRLSLQMRNAEEKTDNDAKDGESSQFFMGVELKNKLDWLQRLATTLTRRRDRLIQTLDTLRIAKGNLK